MVVSSSPLCKICEVCLFVVGIVCGGVVWGVVLWVDVAWVCCVVVAVSECEPSVCVIVQSDVAAVFVDPVCVLL